MPPFLRKSSIVGIFSPSVTFGSSYKILSNALDRILYDDPKVTEGEKIPTIELLRKNGGKTNAELKSEQNIK